MESLPGEPEAGFEPATPCLQGARRSAACQSCRILRRVLCSAGIAPSIKRSSSRGRQTGRRLGSAWSSGLQLAGRRSRGDGEAALVAGHEVQPLERGAQDAGDLHLRDAEAAGDIGLLEILLEAEP